MGFPPKYRLGVEARGCIKNAIAGLVTNVAHDTRFYARTRLFIRPRITYVAICVTACRGRDWREMGVQAKWNIFTFTGGDTGGFVALRQTRPVETPRVRLMYRPVTIINVLSTSCHDKLLRWTDMGWAANIHRRLSSAALCIRKQMFFKWRAEFFPALYLAISNVRECK